MGRTSLRSVARISAILVMVIGLFAAPAGSGLAAKKGAVKSTVPDQIVALDAVGHIVVYGLENGAIQQFWESSSGGWTNFATGDFAGVGYDQVVAMNSTTLQVFNPLGTANIPYPTLTLPGGEIYHLLGAGDFQGYGRDQIVFTYTNQGSGSSFQEWTSEWDPMTNALTWNFDTQSYGWESLVVGKLNTNNDDVVLMRNATIDSQQDNYIAVYGWDWTGYGYTANGTWDLLFRNGDPEGGDLDWGFCCNWTSGVIGPVWANPSPPATGLPNMNNYLVLARDFVGSGNYTELFWWAPGWIGMTSSRAQSINYYNDLTSALDPNYQKYVHNPAFAHVALANLNDDPNGFGEVIGLRQFPGAPPYATDPFLVTLNPNGESGIGSFAPYLATSDYGDQWYELAAGDLGGTGMDMVVVERGDDLRVFYEPTVDETQYVDYTGNGYTVNNLVVANMGYGNLSVLSASPTNLTYSFGCGATSPSQALAVTNSINTGTIGWTAQTSAPWIVLDQTSGTTSSTINVTIDPTQLTTLAASNTGTIVITANSSSVLKSPQTINVTYNPVTPVLAVSPASGLSLTAGWGTSTSGSFALSNSASNAPLSWTASVVGGSSIDWLGISSASGTTPSSVVASVYPHSIGEVGNLSGYVHVSAQDACNVSLSQDVSVAVDVPDPGMVAEPSTLPLWQALHGAAPSRSISILSPDPNDSIQWEAIAVPVTATAESIAALKHGTAHITAKGLRIGNVLTAPPSWLIYSPNSGTSTSQTQSIQVSVDSSNVSGLGTYSAVILVIPTDPFNLSWVHATQVILYEVNQVYQTQMPFIAH